MQMTKGLVINEAARYVEKRDEGGVKEQLFIPANAVRERDQ